MPAFKIDTASVAAISAIIQIMLVLILLHAWRTRTTYPGFLSWVMGAACWLIGISLTTSGDGITPPSIPGVIGIVLIMLDPVLLFEGVRRFHGRPVRWYGLPLNLALVAAVAASRFYFVYLKGDPSGGSGFFSVTAAILFGRVAVEPLLYAAGRRYSIQWLLSAVLVPLVALLLLGGCLHQGSDSLCGLAVFYGIIVQFVIAYGYLSLTSSRVEEELGVGERKYRELSSSLQLRVEEEIQRRLAQERLLAEQSRLAAMGKMIGAIAHQWRQPLTTLGIMVQRIHDQGTMKGLTAEDLRSFKTSAMNQIRHMSDTIEEFRGFYRPEKRKEPFSPLECISDSVTLLEPHLTGNGIEVKVESRGAEGLLVQGYPNEFKQVVLNLLSNSRDAIQEKRKEKGVFEQGSVEVLISLGDAETVGIEISDNGCGVPADTASMIFDPYFTTKEDSGGTGIGLYVSRMIIEDSLGGRLLLASNDQRTTFRIELPIKGGR